MDWWTTLPGDLKQFLLGAGGDFTGGIVAQAVTGLVGALARTQRARFKPSETDQALRRAVGAALHAGLVGWELDETEAAHYREVFAAWLERPTVLREFSLLLSPREGATLDLHVLSDELSDTGADADWLGKVPFDELLARMLAAFQAAAEAEPELRAVIQLELLRSAVQSLGLHVALAREHVELSRGALAELTAVRAAAEQTRDAQEEMAGVLVRIHALLERAQRDEATIQREVYRGVLGIIAPRYALEIDEAGVLQSEGSAAELAEIVALLRALRAQVSADTPPGAAALRQLEHDYRAFVHELFRSLTFKGLSETGRPIALPLEKVYVELKAVADVPEAADTFSADERRLLLEAGDDEQARRGALIHLDALRAQRWRDDARRPREAQGTRLARRSIAQTLADPAQPGVVILGDPGAGKTTLLHYLALQAAGSPDGPLPVFVPLAAYDDFLRRTRAHTALAHFLAVYYERWHSFPGLAPLFRQALEQGRALVLLDGLDEVLDVEGRRFIAAQAGAFITHNGSRARRNRFALTSRIVGYREAPLADALAHVTVVDFGPDEIATFARQWCDAYEAWLARGPTAITHARASREAEGLIQDVHANPSVEHLAANPLLLTMLALLRRQGGRLPERRIELYEKYVSLMIQNWEPLRSAGARSVAVPRFDPRRAVSLLIEVALWLQQHTPSGTARRADLHRALVDIGLRYDGIDPSAATPKQRDDAERAAEEFLRDVRHFAGLMGERGRDAYGFLHLTFQEYFVGRALALRGPELRWGLIRPHLHQPRWREPILLCAGRLGVAEGRRTDVEQLAQSILDAGSAHEPLLHRDLLLCASLANDDVALPPAFLAGLSERLAGLADGPVPSLRRAALRALAGLARLGEPLATQVLERALQSRRRIHEVIAELAPTLNADRCRSLREEVLACLKDGSPHVRGSALGALSSVVSSDGGVRDEVLACLKDGDSDMRCSALGALPSVVASDEDVREAVLACLKDSHPNVRGSALGALSSVVASDEDVREAVLACLKDGFWDVRRSALGALSSVVSSDGGVRDVVLACLKDESSDVRSSALGALSSVISSDGGVRDEVLACLKDESSYVRSSALGALSSVVSSDGGVRDVVLACLKDGDRYVRRSALGALSSVVSSDGGVRDEVLACLKNESWNVRGSALEALSSVVSSDEGVRNVVLACLKDGSWDVRRSALGALSSVVSSDGGVRDEVLVCLKDGSSDMRSSALKALSSVVSSDGGVRDEVLACLKDGSSDMRSSALGALSSVVSSDGGVRDEVLACLKDGSSHVRSSALEALSSVVSSDGGVRDEVLACLKDGDSIVRGLALWALSSVVSSDGGVRDDVLACLKDGDSIVRRLALQALSSVVSSDGGVRDEVLACLKDGDSFVRYVALQALSSVVSSDEVVRDEVLACLKDGNSYVRSSALWALSSVVLSDDVARERVLACLQDREWSVRSSAVDVLLGLAGDAAHAALRSTLAPWLGTIAEFLAEERAQILRARVAEVFAPLLPTDPDLHARVVAMLHSPAWPARQGAAWALTIGRTAISPELRARLIALLDDMRGEESWNQRVAAAESFVNDKDPGVCRMAIAVLTEALDYGTAPWYGPLEHAAEARRDATLALGRLQPLYRDARLFDRLCRVLVEDQDEYVRDAAYTALVQLAEAPEQAAIPNPTAPL